MAPGTGFTLDAIDTSSWRHWWALNKEPYLGLRRALRAGGVVTGSDDFFLGHGPVVRRQETLAVSDEDFRASVLPVLVEGLERGRDGVLIRSALLALAEAAAGREAAAECVGHIAPFLDDGRNGIAETATVALGVLGHPDALSVLEAMVQCRTDDLRAEQRLDFGPHVSTRQRAFAAYSLGLIGERADGYTRVRVVNRLAASIMGEGHRASSHEVPAACVVAMGLVDLPLAPAGAELPERPVALLTRETQVRWLLGLLDEGRVDERVRSQVPISLARLMGDVPGDFELRELAARRLATLALARSGSRASVRRGCVLALGWMGDSDGDELDRLIRASLIEAAADVPDQQTRHFALIALGRAAGRPGTGAGEPAEGAVEARTVLARKLADGSTPVRPWSALGLAILERSLDEHQARSSDETRAILRDALDEARSPDEVAACAIALGILRDPDAAEPLAGKLAKVHDSAARGDVALALGMVDGRGSIEALQEICEDAKYDSELLGSAAIGLALMGDKGVRDRLGELLEGSRSLSSQAALLRAVSRVGDARSLALLVEVSTGEERTSSARALALAALGRVSEVDQLPWAARLSVGANYDSGVETLSSLPRGAGVIDLAP